MLRTTTFIVLASLTVIARADTPGVVESKSLVFDFGNYDPYDRANLYGLNHAPSVTCVGKDQLQTAWFSGPYEASIHQVILGATSDGGRIVLTYNSSAPERTQLSLRVSDDAGKTWSDPLVIAEVQPPADGDEICSRQVCYPSVCELDDGRLRIVWADIEVSPNVQSGVIQSALVRLKENQ